MYPKTKNGMYLYIDIGVTRVAICYRVLVCDDDDDYQTLTTSIYITVQCLSHCVPFHICQIILPTLLRLKTAIMFVCGTPFVSVVVVVFVFVVVTVVAIKCIFSCHLKKGI